ncbi:MAG: RluA family pseudouridine synthase [Deltaproteobacteria bacterium]|nr:RluA family pseudouridine synthase [Deltaproteobacteria bacterium]
MLAIVKPSGWLSQPDGSKRPDIFNWAKNYIKIKWGKPGNVYLGLCHRLDMSVGGVTVFAKTSKTASRINVQFRERTAIKKYLALCFGNTSSKMGHLVDHLVRNFKITNRALPEETGKTSELFWQLVGNKQVIGPLKDNGEVPICLLDILLKSGFKHQIRAQLSLASLPIWGDTAYGGPALPPGEKSIGLFAYELSLNHPITHELMIFKAEVDFNILPWSLWKK